MYTFTYTYIYIYISVYLYSSDHSTFGFGFPFVLKGASLTRICRKISTTPPSAVQCHGKKGGAPKIWRANHLETPRFAKWMTDLSCSYRHANFQTNANPRMFKYIDVLAAEILGTIVWHICFHETRAIQAQESRLKGHRFHMFLYIILKKINKVNHEIQVS